MNRLEEHLRLLAGRFIVFDGPDGCGKSTQFRRFTKYARARGLSVCEVREPGGTAIGERIRNILLDPEHDNMALRCEMLLYMASRAQLISERIRPARQRGELVLADRFVSSTLAYQGSAGGMPLEDIRAVANVAIGADWPDLVVIFEVDEATAARRLNPLLDRMELKGADYHRMVREGYMKQAEYEPHRYLMVDARDEPDVVFDRLCSMLDARLCDMTQQSSNW